MRPVPIALTLVVAGLCTVGFLKLTAPKAKAKTQFTLSTAVMGAVRKTVSATGTLEPWSTVDVKSKAGGRVDLLAVDVGSRVKKGDIIARIDPTDSLLTYNQARASTQSAEAKEVQSTETYGMTVSQDSIAVQQARANLDASKSSLAQARARLDTAQSENEAQPALTQAAISQAKAGFDAATQARNKLTATQTQDRAAAQSAYDQAIANDKNAQVNLVRQRTLLAKGFVSQSTVDSADANAGVTKATVNASESKLNTLDAQQRAERDSADANIAQALAGYRSAQANSIAIATKQHSLAEYRGAYLQAVAAVDTAQAQLANAIASQRNGPIRKQDIASSAADVASARALLANAKATLDQTVVTAPSEGVVLTKYVEQGTIITSGLSLNSTGTSIVTVGDVSRMYVDVPVDETDIAAIHLGEKVDIAFDAFSDRNFKGTVTKVNPQGVVESNVTTVHVRVEVDNHEPGFSDLKPQMNATCEFIEKEATNVVTVPSEAIRSGDGGSYVEIGHGGTPVGASSSQPAPPAGSGPPATGGGKFVDIKLEHRPIKVGIVGSETTSVVAGLSAGEIVVVSSSTPAAEDDAPKAAFATGPGGPPPGGKK